MREVAKHSPFWWNSGYAEANVSCMGGPSPEIFEIAPALRTKSVVVELGCGEGRNALYLGHFDHQVIATDISETAISKLNRLAGDLGVNIASGVARVEDFRPPAYLDVFIAHCVLHFTERGVWKPLVTALMNRTRPGGFHCFTNTLDQPDHPISKEALASGHKNSFQRGELEAIYTEAGWEILRSDHYIKWDSHPGIPIHSHCIEKVVVRKPIGSEDLPRMRAEPIKVAGMIPVKQFDTLKLGTPRDAIVEMLGSPLASYGVKTARKTVGGNNQVAIADGYVREDMIYGDHGLQFVNGTLTGKYRDFTRPKRLLIRNK
ncbi:class I SAM-dependent methyltransferase [Bradyrhizobium septentrionale]|uniref:Class I SAM-dependent methyltransferase n=1 Tax=Bradyrhizobium septentrionale TaxID=1404411 RepID=A0A973VWU2_9BRAD|nr:class I SAM-dependent methyltransferase [Bradyrhizobium septentrionale]UGY12252.1 class I SAM-dependent methyltransferase [Bradyrhizobium septentrionale]UGY25631.1 class I SAM-dependent methyltransferase [Bradyrhizobium septentrionale]